MKMTLVLMTLLVLGCGKKAEVNKKAPPETNRELQDANLSTNQLLAHAVHTGQIDLARNALSAGGNPDLVLISGATLLTYAIQHGHDDMVQMLLERGANPSKQDINGKYPIIHAVQSSQDGMVQMLVMKGASVEQQDSGGRTVLMISISRQREDLSIWLINRGARMDVFDSEGATPLSLATELGQYDFVRLMENRLELLGGTSSTELLANLIQEGDIEGLRILLERGPAILQTLQQSGPIVRAVMSSHEEHIPGILQLLFANGLSPNGHDLDPRTPLAEAARLNRVSVMDILIKRGANIEKLDQLSYSALYHAVASMQPEAVAYLLEAGARANYATTVSGQTANLKACDVARATTPIGADESRRLEEVKQHLRCGYRWFLFW